MNNVTQLLERLTNFQQQSEDGWRLSWLGESQLNGNWGQDERNLTWLDETLQNNNF